jgi:RNA polymerase sigma-70 factor (ECF subfamily)
VRDPAEETPALGHARAEGGSVSYDGSASLDATVAPPAPPIVIRTYLTSVPDLAPEPAERLSSDRLSSDRLAEREPDELQVTLGRGTDPMAELFASHYARLAGWCSRLVGDEQLAHEIAAEAFTRLLTKWRGVEDIRGYLYVTASNLVKDHWRRLERERRALTKVEVVLSSPGADAAPPLRDVVERLPNRHRDVVLLHYYADISVRDTARLLKVSEGAVKRRLFEARALLHEALEGHR